MKFVLLLLGFGFGLRLLRNGSNETQKAFLCDISQDGLVNHHIPVLQGVTLSPEGRTGIIRSLGLFTQAILMVMEDKYNDKLHNAFSHSQQMLTMANEIINALKEANHPGNVSGVLK